MAAPTPVPSPCVEVCQMDAVSGWCEGCLRSLDEIAAWSQMDEGAKAAVWQQLEQRRQALQRHLFDPVDGGTR